MGRTQPNKNPPEEVAMNSICRSMMSIQAGLLLSLVVGTARADEPDDKRKLAAERLDFMMKSVRDFQVVPDGDAATPWKLHPTPLLRWSNPVGGVPDGIIVMWTDGARPAILAQVFVTKDGFWIHECQSLAQDSFTMREGDRVLWNPRKAGGEFRSLEGAPTPGETSVKRLVQMRALAGEFTAYDDFKIHTTDQESTRHELRLMNNPLYRYQDKERQIIDGAVFAFALGTDPELFVVLEAREHGDGSRSWEYALAAMTCWAVEVKHEDRSIWSVGERLQNHSARDAYHVWVFKRE
jgi:hypothetical protein